jgi:hypothetical protein
MSTFYNCGRLQATNIVPRNYHSNRGWLSNKRYPDGHSPDYTYKPSGRVADTSPSQEQTPNVEQNSQNSRYRNSTWT